jgi:hypothetical protein
MGVGLQQTNGKKHICGSCRHTHDAALRVLDRNIHGTSLSSKDEGTCRAVKQESRRLICTKLVVAGSLEEGGEVAEVAKGCLDGGAQAGTHGGQR